MLLHPLTQLRAVVGVERPEVDVLDAADVGEVIGVDADTQRLAPDVAHQVQVAEVEVDALIGVVEEHVLDAAGRPAGDGIGIRHRLAVGHLLRVLNGDALDGVGAALQHQAAGARLLPFAARRPQDRAVQPGRPHVLPAQHHPRADGEAARHQVAAGWQVNGAALLPGRVQRALQGRRVVRHAVAPNAEVARIQHRGNRRGHQAEHAGEHHQCACKAHGFSARPSNRAALPPRMAAFSSAASGRARMAATSAD